MVEEKMEGLSLGNDEDEDMIIDLGDVQQQALHLDLCLVGRFLTDRALNFNVVKNWMASVWRPGKGVCIKDIGSGLFLFQFFNAVDLRRVLENGPWSFDNHLLIIHQLVPGDVPNLVPLFFVHIWVQIYDLPIGYMSETMGKQLGDFIGRFVEYDVNNSASIWRSYMRIKVLLDVRLPFKRYKKIRKQGGDWTCVKFKYKRLGSFCFLCGLLGHTDHFCAKHFSADAGTIQREWGVWLKAPTRKMTNLGRERWLRSDPGEDTDGEMDGICQMEVTDGRDEAETIKETVLQREVWGEKSGTGSEDTGTVKAGLSASRVSRCDIIVESATIPYDPLIQEAAEDEGLCLIEDRKRRRGLVLTAQTEKDGVSSIKAQEQLNFKTSPSHYFLQAGSGFQACQEP